MRAASVLTISAHFASCSCTCRCISESKRAIACFNSSTPIKSQVISTLMLFRLFLHFSSLFLCLAVYLVEDDGELVDGSGWLPCELGWGPPEFFAEAEVCDGWMRFLASDGADKKAVSSRVMAHKSLTILESSSPSGMGMAFSSPNSLSTVSGALGGGS